MITTDTLTDDDIRALQVEAERTEDVDMVHDCKRAYRGNGGGANPYARARIVRTLNERAEWTAKR